MALAYTQLLYERAQAYQDRPLGQKRSPDGLAELAALWAAITGEQAGSCRQCQYSDFNAVVVAYLRASTRLLHPELMSDSAYQLVPGFENETFVDDTYGRVVTADSLTDEDAEYFIKAGYKHAFVKKTAAASVDSTPALGSLTKADLQARHLEVVGSEADDKLTKAQLIEVIEAAGTVKA